MKKIISITTIIAIVLLFGCSDPYETEELFIEAAQDGYFIKGEEIDDVEALLLDIPNPESVEVHILAETGVSAKSVLYVIDLAKAQGFKEVSVSSPTIQ